MSFKQTFARLILNLLLSLSYLSCSSSIPASHAGSIRSFGTPTPTPFQPFQYREPEFLLATPAALRYESHDNLAGSVTVESVDLVYPDSNRINILLLGSDHREGFSGSRTDTIMIISANTATDSVSLISIPRDLYVIIPDWGKARINTAAQHGGPEMVAETLRLNLGIETHHWIHIRFEDFIAIIDTLGGINIDVPETIVDTCDEQRIEYQSGPQWLNGYQALCYARIRKASSDFERVLRQQQVMEAVFDRALSGYGFRRLHTLYSELGGFIDTDMTITEILPLLPLAWLLFEDRARIHNFSIDRSAVRNYTVPASGAAVLLPDQARIRTILEEALAP